MWCLSDDASNFGKKKTYRECFPHLHVPQTLAHLRWSMSKYGGDGSNEAGALGACSALAWDF